MTTNLLQNYITPTPLNSANKKQPAVTLYDTNENKNSIKPLPPKGRLINEGILDYPINFVHNTIYNTNAIKDSYNGKANDHQLGKINDIGLVAGGLSIAGYLATLKSIPKTKAMEFIGLGSFLAAMVVWPKVAIQLPAYLIHGFNIFQQSEDSFGRRKPFFQDPQYLKWDLYSDNDINKIGDKLHVPQNIENRREIIQEKMKKIAVQNNTLWMLTAGFATPIMSALICNISEKPVSKYFEEIKNKKADNLIANIYKSSIKLKDKSITTDIEKLIAKNKDNIIDAKIINEITNILSRDMYTTEIEALKKDLKSIYTGSDVNLGLTASKELNIRLIKYIKGKEIAGHKGELTEEFATSIIPTQDEFVEILKSHDLYKKPFKISTPDLREKRMILVEDILKKYDKFKESNPDCNITRNEIKELLYKSSEDCDGNVIEDIFKKNKFKILDLKEQNKLRDIKKVFARFKANRAVLNEYAFMKTSQTEDSVLATAWNDSVDKMIKTLGLSKKEIRQMKRDRTLTGEILANKFEKIASDKTLYKKTLAQIIKIKNDLTKTLHLDKAYNEKSEQMFNKYLPQFDEFGFSHLYEAMEGNTTNSTEHLIIPSSTRELQKKYMQEGTLSIESTLNRLIASLDLYKRIYDVKNVGLLADNVTPREIKEEIAEFTRKIMIEGRSADYATKFYVERNLHPNLEDKSPIEMKNNRLYRKYGKSGIDKGDIPFDSEFFKKTVSILYKENLHPETIALLSKKDMLSTIEQYRKDMVEKVCDSFYFYKPQCGSVENISDKLKFQLIGKPLDELIYGPVKQIYNRNKWLKIFAGIGSTVLGLTILAQFCFGQTPMQKTKNMEGKK